MEISVTLCLDKLCTLEDKIEALETTLETMIKDTLDVYSLDSYDVETFQHPALLHLQGTLAYLRQKEQFWQRQLERAQHQGDQKPNLDPLLEPGWISEVVNEMNGL